MAGVEVVEDLCDGQGAAAGGRPRALAAHDIGAVDHAPAVMGAHADSAADVADHEAALLVGAPGGGGVANGGLLEVEGVQVHVAIHPADAGHPGLVAKLIGIGRVHDERGPPDAPRKGAGYLGAELSRVLDAVGPTCGVVKKHVVDLVGAAGKRQEPAAAADEGVDRRELHAVFGKSLLDEPHAVRELVRHTRELRELGGLMGDVHGEDGPLAVKEADLGGGRAGVDHEHAPAARAARGRHACPSPASACARTQLMTTLPTISETGALRLQSQTIFLKPWSMGP